MPNNDVKSGFTLIPYSVSELVKCTRRLVDSSKTNKDVPNHLQAEKLYMFVFEQRKLLDFKTLLKYTSHQNTNGDVYR